MQDLGFSLKRTLSILVLTGVGLCSIVLLMNRSDILPDLLIGLITHYLYCLLLLLQYKRSQKMPPQQAVAYLKKSWVSRFCLILLGATFVFHDPGAGMIAFLAGAILPYRVVLFCQSIQLLRKELHEIEPVNALRHCENHQYGTSVRHPLLRPYYSWKQSWYDSLMKRTVRS